MLDLSPLSWLLSAAIVATTSPAPPLPPPPPPPPLPSEAAQAEILDDFRAAETLYVAGRLPEAMSAYQRVFLRTGEPACLANIGRLYEEQGEFQLAAQHYRRFLRHPRAADGQKAQVRERLAAIDAASPDAAPATAAPADKLATSSTRQRTSAEQAPFALKVGGAALIALGTPGLVVGGVMAAQVRGLHEELRRGDFETADARDATEDEAARKQGATIGLLVCGTLALVAGVVMVIGGARRAAKIRRRVSIQGPGVVVKF